MKVLKFILVVLCAAVLLRLAACTTGLAPTPDATPEAMPEATHPALQPDRPQDQTGQPETESDAFPVVNPEQARDAALEVLLSELPEAGNDADDPQSVEWEVEDATPPGLVGAVTTIYRGGGWEVEVQYPVVAPANTRYTVVIRNMNTGQSWEVVLDAYFEPISLNPLAP
jgi:hypothetical protein